MCLIRPHEWINEFVDVDDIDDIEGIEDLDGRLINKSNLFAFFG